MGYLPSAPPLNATSCCDVKCWRDAGFFEALPRLPPETGSDVAVGVGQELEHFGSGGLDRLAA
jgi:hypothetical protein